MKNLRILSILLAVLIIAVFVSPVFSADNLIISDPMSIGVGARPLGMGKAYVAVAEDGDALFINPAGLGKSTTPKLTSMYSSLMGDVNYMVLGGVYPQSANSAIGAGAVMTNVSGIDLRDSLGTSAGSANWGSSVFFLSYGINVEEAKLQLGGSVKYFSQGGSGTASVETAAASGVGFDVGAIYSPNDNLSLGIAAQNPIGTKMTSGNNAENTIPAVVKVGGSYKLKPMEGQKVILAADMDVLRKGPATSHVGAEYQVSPNISLRAGLDQNQVADQIETNPTAGLGLRMSGVEFNYAYHPYGSIADTSTHYFSISYVGVPKAEPDEASLSVALKSPADKSVVYGESVKVEGTAKGAAIVSVNGVNVPVEPTGRFVADVPLSKVGKKLVVVEAQNLKGKTASTQVRVLRLLNFADVPDGYWAKQPIEGTSTVGMIQGYPDGTFKPARVLTRAELATVLVRAKGVELPAEAKSSFKDVKDTHWAAVYINEAVRLGLVKGYPDKKFRPEQRISKAESIAVLARYDALPLDPVAVKPYRDVSTRHWAARYIQAAKDSGMLSYVEGDSLGLKAGVTRAEAVEMMSKTSIASSLIKDLFSWDKGYEFEKSRPTLKASL